MYKYSLQIINASNKLLEFPIVRKMYCVGLKYLWVIINVNVQQKDALKNISNALMLINTFFFS